MVKNPPANAGDVGSVSGLGKSPGEGNGNPLQYCRLANPWTKKPGRLWYIRSQKSWTGVSNKNKQICPTHGINSLRSGTVPAPWKKFSEAEQDTSFLRMCLHSRVSDFKLLWQQKRRHTQHSSHDSDMQRTWLSWRQSTCKTLGNVRHSFSGAHDSRFKQYKEGWEHREGK